MCAFRAGDGSLAIVIGDVCGKGPSAAAVTGLTRHTLRAAALHEASPSRRLSVLNDAVLTAYENGTFCTVADARLVRNGDGAKLTVACGGHPLPVVIHADGTLSEIGRYGSLVGFFEDPEFTDEMVELEPGEAVFFYTDGLVEGRGRQMATGEKRLRKLLRGAAGCSAE